MFINKIYLLPPHKLIGSYLIIFFSAFLLPGSIAAQTSDPWVWFYDTTNLWGFKDLQGNIKVPAMFENSLMSRPDTFYNIIAVSEKTSQYYLLKSGKKVGLDSVYVFDWYYDCEQEGKIRFQDHKINRVGFMDKNGIPIIPAIYNYAYPFRNGLTIVCSGASLKCMDEREDGDTTNCEVYGWVGGIEQIINEKNEILIDSFDQGYRNLNWYSLRMNMPNPDTSLYYTVTGRQGIAYSFVDYNKEFTQWFYSTFIPSLSEAGNVRDQLFEKVRTHMKGEGWVSHDRDAFLDQFPAALTSQRFQTNQLKKISMGQTYFFQFSCDKSIFKKFNNVCGYQRDRFPAYSVSVKYNKLSWPPPTKDNKASLEPRIVFDYREDFEFLRTESGYRLISASFRN